MFSPNFNINDYYELWNDNKKEGVYQQQQPPLSAYSPEFPGASKLHMIHNNSQRGSHEDMSTFTHLKLNKLKMVRFYGYKSLRPIGVNKTMEQLDIDRDIPGEHNESHTVENEQLGIVPPIEPVSEPIDGEREENTSEQMASGVGGTDIDIDDNIPNFDSEETDDFDFEIEEPQPPLSQINEDEGFMAEEVEYQPDHSEAPMPLVSGANSASSNLMPTTATTTTNSTVTDTTTVTDTATNASSIGTAMEKHQEEEDMVLDELD